MLFDGTAGINPPYPYQPDPDILMPPEDGATARAASTSAAPCLTDISTADIDTAGNGINPDAATDVEPSISLADIEDCSYFIQYHPELAEKFSKAKSGSVPVSSQTLSIVFSRLLYWSRYSKHRFGGKLYFWKSQEELGSETGHSTKTINRALKVLVDMGLIVRDKFHKHFYRQVYFYHIPVSPFTKEVGSGGGGSTGGTTRRSNTSSNRPTRVIGGHQQTFHKAPAPQEAGRAEEYGVAAGVAPTGGSSGAAPVAGAPAETRKTSKRRRRDFLSALGASAVPTTSKIDKSRGFSPIGTFCLRDTQETHSLIKHSLKSIIEKCNAYGINPPKPINGRD